MMPTLDRLTTRLARYWPKASLRTYLVAMILLASLPPAALVCVHTFREARDDKAEVENSLLRSAVSTSHALQSELASSFDALDSMSQSPLLQQGDLALLQRQLRQLPAPRRTWDSVFVMDPAGAVVLDTAVVSPRLPHAATQLLQQVFSQRQPTLTGLLAAGTPHVVLGAPVEIDGIVRYVIAARVGAAAWQRLAQTANVPVTAIVSIVGADGGIVGASGGPQDGPADLQPRESTASTGDRPARVERRTLADGNPVYVAWQDVKPFGWGVRVALPAGPIDASHRRAIVSALATSISSLLLGILLAAWVARQVTRPLHRLATQGPREMDASAPVHEIALLQQALLTAQAQDQAAQQRREARAQEFQALFQSSPIGMAFAQDPKCEVISHNAAMDRILALPEVDRAQVRILFRGRPLETAQLPLRRAARLGETVLGMELEIAIEGQPSTFVIANAVPLRDSEGHPRGAISALVDITERKRVEARLLSADLQLRESQRMMELAQEAGHVGFFHYRFGADRLTWTPGQFKLFGIDRLSSGRLQDWIARIDPIDQKRVERELLTACALRREKQTFEYGLLRPDGGSRWLSSRVMITYDANGGAEVLTGVTVDMSEQKRSEREQSRLTNEALEARIETAAASREKDEFLALLGHELRNPLGAISVAMDVLQSHEVDDATAAEARAVISRQTRNLTVMMNDLLDVGRVIAGKIVLTRQPVDLAVLAQRVQDRLALAGATARHEVICELKPAWTYGDATRIEQIVVNLLTNALKYTPPGGRITLATRRAGDIALVEVSDTGEGIAPALLPQVFELLVQGQRAADGGTPGLGIGLTLVRRLVELHGGTVGVESSSAGSLFTVRLPAIEPATGPSPGGLPPARRRKVLVIEEDQDVLTALTAKLELEGHSVATATGGIEGLARLLQLSPEVSLVDIGQPGCTGLELARQARAAGYAGRMIAMSGDGDEPDLASALAAGFDACLVKPIDSRELRAALSED